MVAREGVANATTRRIAEEAGVPQGLIHYWFSGKDELVEEVLTTYLSGFEADIEAAAGEPDVHQGVGIQLPQLVAVLV